MISRKGQPFDASVQFSADKRFVEFLFDRNNNGKQQQNNQQLLEAPKTFRGKELSGEQYQQFKEGQTVYVTGLIDKKQRAYDGYITFNKETGATNFSFDNPDKLRGQVQPTSKHQTQVAVNSEGKTNEATKNIQEPLKTGQENPDNKKQQEAAESPTPAKSTGFKR